MFSGLQGNDMGMMYSKANQNRTDIETTRANKLTDLAKPRSMTLAEERSQGEVLRSKYRGMKNQYAQSLYNQALKDEEDRRRFDEQMAMRRQSAAQSAASSTPTQQQFLV